MHSGGPLRFALVASFLCCWAAAVAVPGLAATVPSGFAETLVTDALPNRLTSMAFTPDGRLFVADQDGQVFVIKNGVLLSTPFVRLTVDARGERGLIGIAVDPEFASNGWVYLHYTASAPSPHGRVSRFTASGDVALPGSEQVLLDLPPLSSAQNHNGGAVHFGPDGRLYVAVGDNAKSTNAQSLATPLGKILRVNKDGSIPTDNPYYGATSGINRSIWALGVRNPFTFAFQPGPGRMFVNDVGQGAYEEINEGIGGSNYGWPEHEGPSNDPAYRTPLLAYAHGNSATTGCAITGGTFYNPPTPRFPASYVGDYFFADFCSGWIRKIDPAEGNVATTFASNVASAIDLDVSGDGALYYIARAGGRGRVFRIAYTGSSAPTISTHPASQTATAGGSATFNVAAGGNQPLSYQWQRNGINIFGATSSSYTLQNVQFSDDGARFRVRVSNNAGTVFSNDAVLTVTANRPPAATIVTPAEGTLYSGGQSISYSGTANDPEEGSLPASRFSWRVDFHHADHLHPFLPDSGGSTSGSFVAPRTGHPESDVWFRIHLTVTDSAGMSATTFRDVRPRLVQVSLATSPAGLELRLDGQPITTPFSFTGVVGVQRQLEASSPQTVNGQTWEFRSWSNGGPRSQTITTPSVDTSYVATFGTTSPVFGAKVNFQPAAAAGHTGYLVDGGATFGSRGNGFSYGWNAQVPVYDRNSRQSPDQRYDTLALMQHFSNRDASWELAVPNGSYRVRVVAGDPTSTFGLYRIAVEGVTAVDAAPTETARWVEGTVTVTVSDGRLTITNAAGASSNKLCFVEVASS